MFVDILVKFKNVNIKKVSTTIIVIPRFSNITFLTLEVEFVCKRFLCGILNKGVCLLEYVGRTPVVSWA